MCLCTWEISGLEGSRDKRSFRAVSLGVLGMDVLSDLKLDHGKAFVGAKDSKITFSRSMIFGYLLLAEPKHVRCLPDKRIRQATTCHITSMKLCWRNQEKHDITST